MSLSCHAGWILNGRLVVQALTLCLGLHCAAGTNGTRAAAQATCTQTLAEFCRDLGALAPWVGRALSTHHHRLSISGKKRDGEEGDPDNKHNDAIPVFQFISSRLEDVLK